MLRHVLIVLLTAGTLSACAPVRPLTASEKQSLAAPPSALVQRVDREVKLLTPFYYRTAEAAAVNGKPLTPKELHEATLLGVSHPDRVRIVVTKTFPMPSSAAALAVANKYGLNDPDVGGRTQLYTIFVKPRYAGKEWLIKHELGHVAQVERMGVEGFLHEYLLELNIVGYSRAPLETQAEANAESIR